MYHDNLALLQGHHARKPHQSFTPWTFTWNTFTGLKDRHKPVDNFDNYPVDFSLFWLMSIRT